MFDVRKSPELQAAIFALRGSETSVRRDINKDVRSVIGSRWQQALRARAHDRRDEVVTRGARVRTRADGFALSTANSSRPLRGGLIPSGDWQPFEFGARVRQTTFEQRSIRGNLYRVTKRVNVQFRPFTKQGRIGFDAASEIGTWAVARWVVSIVRGLAAAAQGKVQ
jgi:hypothetical protein